MLLYGDVYQRFYERICNCPAVEHFMQNVPVSTIPRRLIYLVTKYVHEVGVVAVPLV